jgi:hypothetical protein
MELVKKLPPTPSSRIDMTNHYSACRQAADCIAAQITSESDQQSRLRSFSGLDRALM